MTVCRACEQEMLKHETKTCSVIYYEFPDGKTERRIPYGGNGEDTSRPCHDCNVKAGGYHHPGCDMDMCSRCRMQAIGCGCHTTDEDKAMYAEIDRKMGEGVSWDTIQRDYFDEEVA